MESMKTKRQSCIRVEQITCRVHQSLIRISRATISLSTESQSKASLSTTNHYHTTIMLKAFNSSMVSQQIHHQIHQCGMKPKKMHKQVFLE